MICDNGNPVLCDTGKVLIYVDYCVVTQSVALNFGWNLISSFIVPQDLDMPSIFGSIVSDIIIVKNGTGNSYVPAFGINTIGDWVIEEAYKTKAVNTTLLEIAGPLVDPEMTPLTLSAGWSLMAYLRTSPMDAIAVFNGIVSDVLLVKDVNGASYIPGFGINTIGDLQPGQGYKIKMANAATLIYPDN